MMRVALVRLATGLLLGVLISPSQCAFAENENSVMGRYVGILHHKGIQRDQIAKLDLIMSHTAQNQLQYMAVLTLHFGDFKSGEYVSYHYDNVRLNLAQGKLIFSETERPVMLETIRFGSGEIVAKVRSNWSGYVGELVVKKGAVAAPLFPLIEPIWGEYRGRCDRTEMVVQLYTYRSAADLTHMGNPFAAYETRGILGEDGRVAQPGLCVMNHFRSADYNFFRERLILSGVSRDLVCRPLSDGLDCGGCRLLRVSGETRGPRALRPPGGPEAFPSDALGWGALEDGAYLGYVHHEYLERFQLAELDITTFQTGLPGEEGGRRVSSNAHLYFGPKENAEYTFYRFEERAYPNPVVRQAVVLRNPKQDVDAVVQILSTEKDVIRGVWYSQIFGRVGTFELRKDGRLPELRAGATFMESITGEYESSQWNLDLRRMHSSGSPISTQNPFAPNVFSGAVYIPGAEAPGKARITGGTYDFYTGRIGLERGDTQTFVGERQSRKRLLLKSTWAPAVNPFPSHDPMVFRLLPVE